MAFYSQQWNLIGTKVSLVNTISEVTRVEPQILNHQVELSSISVAKRMSWASHRQTSRIEDQAYSLLGIFDVNMPMLYGEGSKAFTRLQEEIIKTSTDHSIFAWETIRKEHSGALLAESPANFAHADQIVQIGKPGSFEMTNRGLRIELTAIGSSDKPVEKDHHIYAALNCRFENDFSGVLAIRLEKYLDFAEYHAIRSYRALGSYHNDTQTDPLAFGSAKRLNKESRLAFTTTSQIVNGANLALNITRNYEPRSSEVKFWVQYDEVQTRPIKVYPRFDWSVGNGIVTLAKTSRARAGVMLMCQEGNTFVVTFGFERRDRSGRDIFVPHLGMTLQSNRAKLAEFCEASQTVDSGKDPYSDPAALQRRLFLPGQVDEIFASIQRIELPGETLFVVQINRLAELDAVDTARSKPTAVLEDKGDEILDTQEDEPESNLTRLFSTRGSLRSIKRRLATKS